MRRPIITQAWLADFYAEGLKPKYKGSVKRQATGSKQQAIKETVPWNDIAEAHAQPEVASDKHQASSGVGPPVNKPPALSRKKFK